MKKFLIFFIVMLMLLAGCAHEAPVSPEPEQPVYTEQPPVEEQPQVDVPEEAEEAEEPQEPEVPEESEEPVEPEEPEIIETVSYVQAIEDISALIGVEPQVFADYIKECGLYAPGADQLECDSPISYAVAWELLCLAVKCDPDYLHMQIVVKDPPEYTEMISNGPTQDCVYHLYTWGVLHGEIQTSGYADIPAEEFDELLLRAGSPELRQKLLPDQSTLLSWKLDEVAYCACTKHLAQLRDNPAKNGFLTLLSEWEGLERALERSYWILELEDGVYYLNMFTGLEDGTISFTRCSYSSDEQGEILETRILEPYDLYGSGSEIIYSVCMTEEKKKLLEEEFLDVYLTAIGENTQSSSLIPFFEGYPVAFSSPRWEDPCLILIAQNEGKLRSETFLMWNGCLMWYSDQMSHSWYHIYSNTINTGW